MLVFRGKHPFLTGAIRAWVSGNGDDRRERTATFPHMTMRRQGNGCGGGRRRSEAGRNDGRGGPAVNGTRGATKRHGATLSQLGPSCPVRRDAAPRSSGPFRAGSEACHPKLIQVDGSRRSRFVPMISVGPALFLPLAHDGHACHDGCDGHETDTQGSDKRLPAARRKGAADPAAKKPKSRFRAERPFGRAALRQARVHAYNARRGVSLDSLMPPSVGGVAAAKCHPGGTHCFHTLAHGVCSPHLPRPGTRAAGHPERT